MSECKIKIIKNGPYIVTGSVPIEEKIIVFENSDYSYTKGRELQQAETYALCRCGQSGNMPFCDGYHAFIGFDGKEVASKDKFMDCAIQYEGSDFVLHDQENLCAFARFCHKSTGDVWSLTEASEDPVSRLEAIQAACDCPAGRLVIVDKMSEKEIEPEYEKSIVIIQDPESQCSGPIWVRGGIPIESADGSVYEVRNRVTLCRCGKSNNKPFCDAYHIKIGFRDTE
jgi:CDGSH-type Zn-finger protein